MNSPVALLTQLMSRVMVEADIRGNAREEQVPARAGLLGDADPLALQFADGSDGLMREQLVAAGMHARQRGNRLAGIHRETTHAAICKAKSISPLSTSLDIQIADVGEPFRAQQLLGDLSRREADGSATL